MKAKLITFSLNSSYLLKKKPAQVLNQALNFLESSVEKLVTKNEERFRRFSLRNFCDRPKE